MALNPNHTFEDLGDHKCAIVEKNCSALRADFLKNLLEHNGFQVITVKSPPPKAAKPAAPPADGAEGQPAPEVAAPLPPDTFSVGVTDLTFSPTNAVFNRELITPQGEVVNIHYWKQLDKEARQDDWYWA